MTENEEQSRPATRMDFFRLNGARRLITYFFNDSQQRVELILTGLGPVNFVLYIKLSFLANVTITTMSIRTSGRHTSQQKDGLTGHVTKFARECNRGGIDANRNALTISSSNSTPTN